MRIKLKILIICIFWGSLAFASTEEPGGILEIENQISTLRDKIYQSEEIQKSLGIGNTGLPAEQLQYQLVQLRKTETAYQRLLTAVKRKSSLQKELELLKKSDKEATANIKSPPYNLSDYDTVDYEYSATLQFLESAAVTLDLERKSLDDALEQKDQAAQQLRAARDQFQQLGNAIDLKKAQIDLDYATALHEMHKIQYSNAIMEKDLARLKSRQVERKKAWVQDRLIFDETDLAAKLDELQKRRALLDARKNKLLNEQQGVEKRWLSAQEQQADEGQASATDQAFLHERELWRQTYQKVLEQTDSMLQLTTHEEQIWQRRHELVKNVKINRQTLENWQRDVSIYIASLKRMITLQENDQTSLQPQLSSINKVIAENNLEARQHYENGLLALSRLMDRNLEYAAALRQSLNLARRLQDEIGLEKEHFSITDATSLSASWVRKILDTELWVIDEHPVTISKLLVAVLILVIGVLLTKFILRKFTQHMSGRLDKNSLAIMEAAIYYFVFFILVLFALKTVNIPLTIFTLMGGALAIGIGFGAQNLLNNFISGFIIMAEQPIRIGDIIEIEGKWGVIQEVGARCTRILTFDNADILVPNSSFLEKNIINWSKTDQVLRANVKVGVAYGSDTRKVEQLLIKAANDHPKVLKAPQPFVLFREFGDNSLNFELFVWIPLSGLWSIPSDLRYSIDNLFRQNGITIAFPQVDVHIKES